MELCQERTTGSKCLLMSKGDAKAVAAQGKPLYVLDYLHHSVHKLACLLNEETPIGLVAGFKK